MDSGELNRIIEGLRVDIKESYDNFETEEDFDDMDEMISSEETLMRAYDVGRIQALQGMLNILGEYQYLDDEELWD
tara:strand:+ start:155 stop:382 length:228 start_codon:yes stop_codon:yes gene_type:complete